ncbi:YuiA family protein [Halalkalibacterium ligniniphilum]|uniref:YuiA family protein n=1 Tax=Halalkalibacterium ligniniphilum TaxID=1134413 RepID=UPI0003478ADA|nr:YuiA family protein [Halalkalibacterium ligniniphilum]
MKKGQLVFKVRCPYCNGNGYFQLLLGGSETCDYCRGEGQLKHKEEKSTVS